MRIGYELMRVVSEVIHIGPRRYGAIREQTGPYWIKQDITEQNMTNQNHIGFFRPHFPVREGFKKKRNKKRKMIYSP